ncbi:Pycsar system effector family protein [Streptomyces sp. NPDC127068]|uniref:Pycsar system effector family protein n=1 Tax=Streptomyces sp. NPDC127068 TaxID=3347127 RepID=UPI00365ABBE2
MQNTTPTTSNVDSRTDKNLDAACAATASEIARTDVKASLLLAFNGAALAGLTTLADKDLPPPTKTLGALAILALSVAAVFLLLVARPRISRSDRKSFPYWATLTPSAIRACMTEDTRAAGIQVLSTLAVTKFTRLRYAVDLSLTAMALLALAAISTAL